MSSPFARADTVVFWDTFDCPILRNKNFTEVFLITRSALEEKGVYVNLIGGLKFIAFVGDATEYPGFPAFGISKTTSKDDRLWRIIIALLAQANLKGNTFLNLMLVVGDISEHVEFKRAIRLLNSRSKFNVLLAQRPPHHHQYASSSSGEVIDKEWICSRLSAGETFMKMFGIGKSTSKEEEPQPPSLNQIPKPLPSHHHHHHHQEVAKVPFTMPKDSNTLCLSRHMAQRARTMVFWDTRDFPLPAGLHAYDVLQNIEDALSERGYCGRVSLTAFLDGDSSPGFSGCNISFLEDGDRDARLWQIALRLLAAARRTRIEPLNHMLLMGDISGHIELLRTIYLLNLRFSHNVILAQPPPQNVSSSGQKLLGKEWLCSSLSAGEKLLSQIEQKLIMTTVVQPLTPWQERYKTANTVVLWDLVECPIPVGITAAVASQFIRSAFDNMGYRGTVTIHAFGHVNNLEPRDVVFPSPDDDIPSPSSEFLEDMNQSGIVFHDTPTAHKDARLMMMREVTKSWDHGNDGPANVMAILLDISDDDVFGDHLKLLRSIDYNVVLAQPHNALGELFDMEWLCSRLGDRFLPIQPSTTYN